MKPSVSGLDLFCGAGGLTYGLRLAGIAMVAGIDLDPACAYPFEQNNRGAKFLQKDVSELTRAELANFFVPDTIRLLAGCAPCQPFSSHRRGQDTSKEDKWNLLSHFSRLVEELKPELVTMENVPRLGSKAVFLDFLRTLDSLGYSVDWRSVYCPRFRVPQHRRRLVLMASLLGKVKVPSGPLSSKDFLTVERAIDGLPAIPAGGVSEVDPVHRARKLSELNLMRIRAAGPGGSWSDWPIELRSACHLRKSGSTFRNVYSRMSLHEPAPTITTEALNFGTGRFGHPNQDRAISLREAALLQGFPRTYRFSEPDKPVYLSTLGRLIGNAVPPPLAFFIGRALLRSIR